MHKLHKRWRKFKFYSSSIAAMLCPDWWYNYQRALADISPHSHPELYRRRDYYCKLAKPFELAAQHRCNMKDIPKGKHNTYYFDFMQIARYFDRNLAVHYEFGDVKHIPAQPMLTKSRPITVDNHNSVILKWNQLRHRSGQIVYDHSRAASV